ncbi:CoA pyrophosphatase [Nocardioides marmoriginsengisoli]|uniref:CoA pyrophosphatase n=1 Tax=Nocardioides marmoriginsengisoli TaxID=661483 RepID=A0A3N0CFD4_9ACTN|nr:CoA pyrophosphatase [Nocardioides marmoriginsengisoli]RNL62177.1 CoA pyrophosphatase [Nocardioides marmoriginsengisoli]
MTTIPEWLVPIRDGAQAIRGEDITAFLPPADSDARPGAVLMLFGEGPHGPDLLLTERAHTMRSHPGQVSFPGGSVDATDASPIAAALREAEEEVGVDPDSVDVLATLPELWLPPSNFAVTPVLAWWRADHPVGVVDPAEVHAVFRTPIAELLDPAHRVTVTHPAGYSSPGFLIGEAKDVLLWGFTAGLVNKLFDFVGMTLPWDASITHELPDYMLGAGQDER